MKTIFWIDWQIFVFIGKIVRFWCACTGKSNFDLCRVLLGISFCLMIAFLALMMISAIGQGNVLLTIIGLVIFYMLGSGLLTRWRNIQRLEKTVAETKDTLPSWVRVSAEKDAGERIVNFGIMIILYLLTKNLPDFLIGSFFLVVWLELHVRYHFNPRGGGKIRKLILQIARAFKQAQLPVPQPNPA